MKTLTALQKFRLALMLMMLLVIVALSLMVLFQDTTEAQAYEATRICKTHAAIMREHNSVAACVGD